MPTPAPNEHDRLVGLDIQRARRLKGWSQARLAREMSAAGYAWRQNTVSLLETGDRRLTIPELLAIGAAMQVDPWDLVGRAISRITALLAAPASTVQKEAS
jgi:transcriptional regulator with XRE-family HTH domain